MVSFDFRTALASVTVCLALGCGDGSGSGNATGPVDVSCPNPQPLLQADGSPSGFETCENGVTHRAVAMTCVVPDPPQTCVPISEAPSSCQTSDDCTDRPHGACLDDGIVDPSASMGCRCVYSCETDADCGQGTVCTCLAAGRPQCVGGECGTTADCEGLCIRHTSAGACGGLSVGLACLDPEDECAPGQDNCPEMENCNGVMQSPPCELASGQWRCGTFECATSCG